MTSQTTIPVPSRCEHRGCDDPTYWRVHHTSTQFMYYCREHGRGYPPRARERAKVVV
jgi:hypothetical protein